MYVSTATSRYLLQAATRLYSMVEMVGLTRDKQRSFWWVESVRIKQRNSGKWAKGYWAMPTLLWRTSVVGQGFVQLVLLDGESVIHMHWMFNPQTNDSTRYSARYSARYTQDFI